MATTKQDLRQIEAKTQDFEQLGATSGSTLAQIVDKIDTDLNFPLKLAASFPTADSILNFSDSNIECADGSRKTITPIKKVVYSSISSLWVDFQAPAASRLSDPLTLDDSLWPTTTTLNNFSYACFTVTKYGKVQVQFTPESPSILTLQNPGLYFIKNGLPIGYLLLQATSTNGKFKTAGSVASIIENFGVYKFGSGGGGGGGSADVVEFTLNNNQSSPLVVDEMIVDVLENSAFKAEYSVRRIYDPEIVNGGQFDATFSTLDANNTGSITDFDILSSNGSIVVGGNFPDYTTSLASRLMSFDSLNTVDISFCQNAVYNTKFNGNVNAVKVQSDGKILIGGAFTNYAGVTGLNYLIRLNADGTQDALFNSAAVVTGVTPKFNGAVNSIDVAADGSIYIGGAFTNYTATGRNFLAKLNSSGVVDDIFMNAAVVSGITARISALINVVKVHTTTTDLIFGGSFVNYLATGQNYLAKVSSVGTSDSLFMSAVVVNVSTARFNGIITAIEVLSDDSILVSGGFTNWSTQAGRSYLLKFSSLNALDTGFCGNATYTTLNVAKFNGQSYSIKEQSDGKILFGGSFTNYTATGIDRLIRLESSGLLDTSFTGFATVTGIVPKLNTTVTAIHVQVDGKILVGGAFINYGGTTGRNYLIKLNTDGTNNTAFTSSVTDGGKINAAINAIAIQSNANLLIGGAFTNYTTLTPYVAKLNADGSVDTSFSQSGTGLSGAVRSVELGQISGKIFVGGSFTTYNAISRPYIARLNANGALDTTFAPVGTGLNGAVNYLVAESNESKILVCGEFTTHNAVTANRLIRLTSAGAVDTTFIYGTGFNAVTYTAAQLFNGSYIIGGDFTTYNGVARARLAKINYSGSLDTTFTVGTGFNGAVRSIHIQSDNKILVGGDFTSYNGTSVNRLIRLNSDGTIDSTFTIGTGFNNTVLSIKEQLDNKILVGGTFTLVNGLSIAYMVRLRASGVVDNTYIPDAGIFDLGITSIKIQSDDNILVSGGRLFPLTGVNNRITRIISGSEVAGVEVLSGGSFRGFYRPSTLQWELQGFESSGDVSGLSFSIDSSGQMYYTSSELNGVEVESVLRFRLDLL